MTEVTISDIGNALVAIDIEVKRIDDEVQLAVETILRLQSRRQALCSAAKKLLDANTYVLEKY